MKRIKAIIYFGNEGARDTMIVTVDDNTTESEIENVLREEALSLIDIEWHEDRLT